MSSLNTFLSKRPVLAAISLIFIWFVLIMTFTGIAVSVLKKDFGDSTTLLTGHLAGIILVLTLLWRLGWLKVAGITRYGTYQVWLIAITGTIYFALASLYSYYGKLTFNLSNVTDLSLSKSVIKLNIAVCMDEEFLFRGAVLYILVRSWGDSLKGRIGGVILMSGIFALLHLSQIVFWDISTISAVMLAFETFTISIWWASMVLKGGSIWPVFIAHYVINTVVALQANSQSIIQPEFQAYLRQLLFSLPLGITGVWMIIRMPDQKSGIS